MCQTNFHSVQEEFKEPLFDVPHRETFGEQTSIPGEKCLCF